MEQRILKAMPRERTKKGPARRLRRAGHIPAVIYGRTAPRAISVDEYEFNSKFQAISESTIIKLNLDQQSLDVLIRDFQENVITGKVTHIDFYEIERGKQLRTNVSVHLEGAAIGVREGGLLETFVHEIEVECLPKDLPEHIVVDIADLAVGDSVHVSEMQTPEGVRLLNPGDQVVCTIAYKRVEEEEEVAVEGVEEEAAVEEEEAEVTEE